MNLEIQKDALPSNANLIGRLANVECRDSTYKPQANPMVFERALGSKIWDVEGREYIDLSAGFGALPLGHNSVALQETAKDVLLELPKIEHAMGDVYPSAVKIEYLETLQAMLPSQFRLGALALSGGQSVELAVKTAILATRKTGIIAFDGGYHGLDLGILPLTSRIDFRKPFSNWMQSSQVERVPYGCGMDTIVESIRRLEAGPGFCGIIAEPIQGRAGVKIPSSTWLKDLSNCARENSGLLILDEVFTGFGRLGNISASENVEADILCFGKAIGGGFPISACFASREIMNAWPQSPGEALHTGTFFGHPFSAAVGLRTLNEIKNHDLANRARIVGSSALDRLRSKLMHAEVVKDVRGLGLMIGIEFQKPGVGAQLMDHLRAEGVIVLPSGAHGEVLSLSPALNIDQDLLNIALDKLEVAICRLN